MRMTTGAILTLGLLGTLCADSFASPGMPLLLDPKTYTSSSGQFSLRVDPTDRYGGGPADYQLAKDGKPVWSKRLPFTLWEAVVTDTGFVAGYAYTTGKSDFTEGPRPGKSEFVVAVVSPTGDIVNAQRYARETLIPDARPDPLGEGLVFDENSKHFIVRVWLSRPKDGGNRWWVFDLHSGKRTGERNALEHISQGDASLHEIAARAIPGTPLVLVQFWRNEDSLTGTVFALLDAQGKPVWTLNLNDDYTVPGDEKAEEHLHELVRDHGVILGVTKTPSFDIYAAKEKKRVSFSIEKAADGSWRVQEQSRVPHDIEKPAPKETTFPALSPAELAVVQLGESAPKKAWLRDIVGFTFDAQGRICVLHSSEDVPAGLTLVSSAGEPLGELKLPVDKVPIRMDVVGPAYVGESQFLVTASNQEATDGPKFYVGDFGSKSVKELDVKSCPGVAALVGFDDGAFAAITGRHERYSVTEGLYFFDPRGKIAWKKEQAGYSDKPEELLSPTDIAACGTSEFAVLDNVAHTVQFFDRAGAFHGTVDLGKAWGRQFIYPTNISEDAPDGFVIYDFSAEKPIIRADAEGHIRSEFAPKLEDGRTFQAIGGVKRSPLGELWTSDGTALMRLTADGAVDRVVGTAPAMESLTEPSDISIGLDGRIEIRDGRTGGVHVFDASGKKLEVRPPPPEEGSLIERTEKKANEDELVSGRRHPSTGDMSWVRGSHGIILVKGDRQVICRISRHANGRWIDYLEGFGVAPDGSCAVGARNGSDSLVSTYGPAGEPRATFAAAIDSLYSLAYDGQFVFLRKETDVYVLGPEGQAVGIFNIEPAAKQIGEDRVWSGPFIAAKGTQLWFVNRKDMKLHKFANPCISGARTKAAASPEAPGSEVPTRPSSGSAN